VLHCEGLSKHAHFRNFGMAFLTLFRVATGDNWNGIMKVSDVLFFWHCGIVAAYVSSLSHFCFELKEGPPNLAGFWERKGERS